MVVADFHSQYGIWLDRDVWSMPWHEFAVRLEGLLADPEARISRAVIQANKDRGD